jgi:hypothetical protein
MQYRSSETEGEEASRLGGFLWGLVTPPEWLLAGGSFRLMELFTKVDGASTTAALIVMQADLRAAIRAGPWRAAASAGVVTSDGSAASVAGSFVSRQYWVGYAFDEDAVLLRAGRIDLPFGIRSIEHTLFVRSATRTDLNDTQQHGVAIAYSGAALRGELMGIAGNFQASPDAYRERGYSGYFEWSPHPRGAIGVSSLATHVATDPYLHVANTRQAHGLFGRVAPWRPLVLMLEADLVLQRPEGAPNMNGYATMLQADIEPLQGLHLVTTGETYLPGGQGVSTSYSGWFGVNWFFAPHADVRIDVMGRHLGGPVDLNVTAYIGQLHIYL